MALPAVPAVNDTTSSGLSSVMKTYYDREMLFREKQELVFAQFAWNKEIPHNEGKTVQFSAYRPLATPTSPLTEGANDSHTDYSFTTREVTVTPRPWGATASMSKEVVLTKLDQGLVEQMDIISDQRVRTIDEQLAIEVGTQGIFPLRADLLATHNAHNLRVIGDPANTTTTFSVHASDLAGAVTNAGAGAIVCFTDGTEYGYTGRLNAGLANVDQLTFDTTGDLYAMPQGFTTSGTAVVGRFSILEQATLAATDVLSADNIRAARKHLRLNLTPKFDGSVWLGAIDPNTESDFMNDVDWVETAKYSDKTKLYNGEVGMWMGIRFVGTTRPYRENLAGATDLDSGGIIHQMIFGRKAFAHAKITGPDLGIQVLSGPDKQDPLNMTTVIGWKERFRPKALTAPHCVSILCGATGVAMA